MGHGGSAQYEGAWCMMEVQYTKVHSAWWVCYTVHGESALYQGAWCMVEVQCANMHNAWYTVELLHTKFTMQG